MAAAPSSPDSSELASTPNAANTPMAPHSATWAPERKAVLRRTRRSRWGTAARGPPLPRPLLDLQDVLLHRVDHGLHPGVELELLQDVADVVLHGVLGDVELLGDVAVVQPPGHELQDLQLPLREPRRRDLLAVLFAL